MSNQKPLFKSPYDIRDVSALFAIVAFVLIIAAIVGNNLFGIFQQNVNFGQFIFPSNDDINLLAGLHISHLRE